MQSNSNQSESTSKILGIIPVRMESARLPNKPLANIHGKALVLWVYEHAKKSKCFSKVAIATDSEAIRAVAEAAGAEVIMTSSKPLNGTERVAEALSQVGGSWDMVFNVQGDMPFIQPRVIEMVAESFKQNLATFDMVTLALPILDEAEYNSSNSVKVVFAHDYRALYFSRSSIPYYRSGVPEPALSSSEVTRQAPIAYKHVGLYGFRPQALAKIVDLSATPLEKAENLEQLRALEHGFSIKVVPIERELAGPSIEVDTAADLEKANEVAKTYLMP